MAVAALIARLLLAAVFAAAGMGKLLDFEGARGAVRAFGAPERLRSLIALTLALSELAVALGLLVSAVAWWAAVGAVALLVMFVVVLARAVARGESPDCHCFGRLHSAPVGRGTLVRDVLLLAVGVLVVAHGPGGAGISATAWLTKIGAAGLIALAAAGVIGALVCAGGWLVVRLLRRHGRLLARAEQLEAALARAGSEVPDAASVAANGHGVNGGLPVGWRAPGFELPDLDGKLVTLTGLLARKRPLMLVFAHPSCGPCDQVLRWLAESQHERADRVAVVVIGEGSVAAWRGKRDELGLQTALVQHAREVAEAYGAARTPAAALISPQGTLASAVGFGPSGVRDVLDRARIDGEERGLALGADAPEFELPAIDGEPVSLGQLRGAPTALLFWNPSCGFCRRMLADLRGWWQRRAPGAPRVVIVSRGSVQENRALGVGDAIALDDGFTVAARYGATGTPMALMIDDEGRIASPVAAGAQAVLALLAVQGHGSPAVAQGGMQ